MSNTRSSSPSVPMILLHLLLTMLTGGTWLIVLIIWYILKKN